MQTQKTLLRAALLGALLAAGTAQAGTIVITSRDPVGVGFNDPTPVAPVGGNPKTTLGEQRMYVYRFIADLWQQQLNSNVVITVNGGWEALTCTAGSAVLGSAGAWNLWHDFPGGKPGTWYPQALANKLASADLSAGQPDDGTGYGNVDIKAQFNVNLGNTGCLDGSPFYLGIDGNAGSKVDFAATLMHELAHGLGFSVMTVYMGAVTVAHGFRLNASGQAYVASGGVPSVWEQFMHDNTAGKSWLQMNSTELAASMINPLQLAWTGPNAVAGATLLNGTPVIRLATSAPGYTGVHDYTSASFGAPVGSGMTLGALAVVPADATPGAAACQTLSGSTAAAVAGKVALIDRGGCGFSIKAKNAQDAGAIGVIIANNEPGAAPGLGGNDPTVTVPTIGISQADGVTLKAAVAAAVPYGTRGKAGMVTVSLGADRTRLLGADSAGRPLLYTPNPLVIGSSVSHWDVSASPNLLMEPRINADLSLSVVPPKDLTLPLLKDIGW